MIKKREKVEVSTSSMADIAFLLLIFFLVTTTIVQEKGLTIMLPSPPEEQVVITHHERNIYNIHLNSSDQFLVEGEVKFSLLGVREEIKTFIMNNGRLPHLSDNPTKAIVSIRTDRGTTYSRFIAVLDEVKAAYYELYAEQVNLTPDVYRELDTSNPHENMIYQKGKEGIPMNISIAEPTP